LTRFLVEFVRSHDPQSNPLTGPFTTEQWLSLSLIALGAGVWLWARRNVVGRSVPVRGAAS
jgi:prolipoprotein diacylglyceryltransferase